MSDVLLKTFETQDVFFNNGIINLLAYLQKNPIAGCEYTYTSNELSIKICKENEEAIFYKLLENLIKENNIVHLTKNDRLYWYKEKGTFKIDKRFDVEGKASPNDVKNIFDYISVKELNISSEDFYELYNKFADENKVKQKDRMNHEIAFRDKSTGSLKSEDMLKIPLYITLEKAISNFTKYLVKGNTLPLDSKIHQFEDGGYCFRDLLSNNNVCIDKWDALIYWYGCRIGRLFNSNYYIYLNSLDLNSLKTYKTHLNIPNRKARIIDEKTEEIKEINTNINIYEQLNRDGIKNKNFYISNSQQEVQVKFLMYLYSTIYHIEDDYENKIKDERRKIGKKELYDSISKITFVTYTEDGPLKSSLEEYTKAYKMFEMFEKLITQRDTEDQSNLFKYLADLITIIRMSKPDRVENLNIRSFSDNILSFKPLRCNYYEASFDILKNDKRGFGSNLYLFEGKYLEFTERSKLEMSMHMYSKKLGEEIGYLAATFQDENLLYKLRNIKNFKQLVSYIKDLKFAVLKHQKDEKKESRAGFTNEFNEILLLVLQELEKDNGGWELVRDYIAIYAIDKYRITKYAKSMKEGN